MNTSSSGRSTSLLGSRKSMPCEYASNAVRSVSAAPSNPLTLGVGVVAGVSVIAVAPPPEDPAQPSSAPVQETRIYSRCDSPRISFERTLTTFSASSNGDSVARRRHSELSRYYLRYDPDFLALQLLHHPHLFPLIPAFLRDALQSTGCFVS